MSAMGCTARLKAGIGAMGNGSFMAYPFLCLFADVDGVVYLIAWRCRSRRANIGVSCSS